MSRGIGTYFFVITWIPRSNVRNANLFCLSFWLCPCSSIRPERVLSNVKDKHLVHVPFQTCTQTWRFLCAIMLTVAILLSRILFSNVDVNLFYGLLWSNLGSLYNPERNNTKTNT